VLPRSSRSAALRLWSASGRRWTPALAGALALSLAGCSGGGAPTPTAPPKPPAAAAKPGAPGAAPAPAATAEGPPYAYEAKGRRDPFRPLIAPRTVEAKQRPKTGLAALEVTELKLAGIVWDRRGFFALVEAPNGAGYVLRVNDMVGGEARVTRITPEAVTFEVKAATVREPGATRLVELRMRKEE
jgi:hypothetical protein